MARLRLDNVNSMDPGAPDPIGTLKEIKKLNLPTVKYASCSAPTQGNRGCRHFDDPLHGPCPIRALLRERARPGPENVGFARVKSPKVWKMDATTCFHYMSFVAHDDPKNGISQVMGLGGDYYIKRRTTQPIDKDNPKSLSKFVLHRELVPRFPRPDVSMQEHSEVTKMAGEMIRAENRSTLSTLLGGANVTDEGVEDDEVEVDVSDDLDALDDDDVDGATVLPDEEDELGPAPEIDLEDERPRRGRGREKKATDGK